MKETINLKLKKPENIDLVDISILNGNMDILDEELKDNKTDILTLKTDIGDKTTLTTDIKANLVNAINEHETQINNLDAQKAEQTSLDTEITNRTNAVLAEKSERLAEVAVERARINSFTTLAAGSTTGDAELIDARIGADGKTYANAGDAIRGQNRNLKEDLSDLKAVTIITENVTDDITNDITWSVGFVSNTGLIDSSVATMHYSQKIPVSEGDVLSCTYSAFRYITAYNGNTAVSASGDSTGSLYTYTVPSGIDGIIVTCYVSAQSNQLIYHQYTAYKNILDDDIATLNNNIQQLSNDINQTIIVAEYEDAVITEVTPIFTTGYVNPSTGLPSTEYPTYQYPQKISVQEGDVITASPLASFRWVAAFLNDVVVPAAGETSGLYSSYVVPSGVDSIIPTVYKSANVTKFVVSGTETKESYTVAKPPMGYMQAKGDLTDGASLTLPYHNVKNNNVLMFTANIGTFGQLKIGKQADTYILIDATNISVYSDSATVTKAHGLTISGNIQVIIKNETAIKASLIRISSGGNEFSITDNERFLMDMSAPYAVSIGSTLTDCVFSWTSRNINKPIWLFGDSYFSWYHERWTYYLARDGFINSCMLNGYAGQASATACRSLENLLSVRVPEMVVWCLGMNDEDGDSAVNPSWQTYYNKVVTLSKKYGFKLALCTIPTTPTMNNNYKNAVIRASGYRYIDADKAVRIDEVGNWITGALDVDNVHPTALGAKILYYKFLSDLPELTANS